MKQENSLLKYFKFWEVVAMVFMLLFFGILVAIKISFGHEFRNIKDILAFAFMIIFPGLFGAVLPIIILNFIVKGRFNIPSISRKIDKMNLFEEEIFEKWEEAVQSLEEKDSIPKYQKTENQKKEMEEAFVTFLPKKLQYTGYKKYKTLGEWWENEGRGKFPAQIAIEIAKLQKGKGMSFHEAFEFLDKK